jgi:hypothetical protein
MNVEIRTVAVRFLFWEYLFRIFGVGSLQCVYRAQRYTCTYVRASSGYNLEISPHSPNVPSSAEVYPAFLPTLPTAAVAVANAVAVAALSAVGTDVQPAHDSTSESNILKLAYEKYK